MKLDFLGLASENEVIGESPRKINDAVIILTRGFFFGDSIKIYDTDGNPIDRLEYSFDIPVPAVSSRMGRAIFGRIIMKSDRAIGTIDYKTPYYVEDNRVADIYTLSSNNPAYPCRVYYDHFAGLMKTIPNTLAGSDIESWLDEIDNLIAVFRDSVIADDVLLDEIDEVFTRGIIRDPEQAELPEGTEKIFIPSGDSGNSLAISKWNIDWMVDDNLYSVDYKDIHGVYRLKLNEFKSSLDKMIQTSISGLVDRITPLVIPNDDTDNVTSIGSEITDDIALINGNWHLRGNSLPAHYASASELLKVMDDNVDDLEDAYELVSESIELNRNTDKIISILRGRYTTETLEILDSTLRLNDDYLGDLWSKERLGSELEKVNLAGDVAAEDSLTALDAASGTQTYTINFDTMEEDLSELSLIHPSVDVILDSLCITKSELNHTIAEPIDLGEL